MSDAMRLLAFLAPMFAGLVPVALDASEPANPQTVASTGPGVTLVRLESREEAQRQIDYRRIHFENRRQREQWDNRFDQWDRWRLDTKNNPERLIGGLTARLFGPA